MKEKEHIRDQYLWVIVFIIVLLFAIFRYFWKLDAHPCFEDDEYQTVNVGQWYSSKMSTTRQREIINELRFGGQYERAWPYTIILGNWIHIIGFSESKCREPSAIFGVLTVISLFYISFRLYNKLFVSILSSFLLISEPVITQYFRLARMYGMAVFVGLWLYYVIYRMITLHNPITKRFALIDFHPFYALIAVFLLYLAYYVHINILISGLGVMLYILICAVLKREKRFIIWSVMIIFTSIILVISIIYFRNGKYLSFMGGFLKALTMHGAFFVNIYLGYFYYFLKTVANIWIGLVLFMIAIIYAIISIKMKIINEADIYLLSLCIATVFFFVCMTDRYYIEYYMCMLMPYAALFFASAVNNTIILMKIIKGNKSKIISGEQIFASEKNNSYFNLIIKKILIIVFYLFFFILVIVRIVLDYDEVYTPIKAMDYRMAYDKIHKYYDAKEEIPLVNLFVREPYFSDIFPYSKQCHLNRETDIDVLYRFAIDEDMEGIITCEDLKFGALTQGMMSFITDWSDHLSGDGVDTSNVEVSHYYFILPKEVEEAVTMDNEIVMTSKFDERNNQISIYLDRSSLYNAYHLSNIQFICVKLNLIGIDGGKYSRYYQLIQKDEIKGNIVRYDVEIADADDICDITISDKYAFYLDGHLCDMNGNILL